MSVAFRKIREPSSAERSPNDDVMIDPLHPMHRQLLARMSAPAAADRVPSQELIRPPRMAIPFYAAIGAWGAVWLMFQAVTAAL